MKRKVFPLVSILVLVGVGLLILFNLQWMRDQYIVRTSSLQPAAAALENKLDLTSQGSFIYKASQPEVQSADKFNISCADVAHEQSIVLGCYTAQRFYVYDVKDPQFNGVKEVTAAHEMLHGAYERLSVSERKKLDQLLLAEEKKITNPRLRDTIALYQKTEPTEVLNELHSIFGTEVAQLSPELEQHYKVYFQDRQKIVAYAQQYEKTFTDIDQQIKAYDQQLMDLKISNDDLESTLAYEQAQIQTQRNQLETLKNQGALSEYNAAVPAYNALIQTYNANVSQLKDTVTAYNQIVEKRNGLATAQNRLVQQLNSNYQSL